MTNLEKVKSIIEVEKIYQETEGELELHDRLACRRLIRILIHRFGISPWHTTPKDLYGKSYSSLTRQEKAEYAQIKRLIKRRGVYEFKD